MGAGVGAGVGATYIQYDVCQGGDVEAAGAAVLSGGQVLLQAS